MKTYEKPIIIENKDLAEGVFASGSGCYTTSYNVHQKPEIGRGDYRIQVDAKHDADHNSNYNQCLHIVVHSQHRFLNTSLQGFFIQCQMKEHAEQKR